MAKVIIFEGARCPGCGKLSPMFEGLADEIRCKSCGHATDLDSMIDRVERRAFATTVVLVVGFALFFMCALSF